MPVLKRSSGQPVGAPSKFRNRAPRSTIRLFSGWHIRKSAWERFQSHNLGATLLVYSQPRKAGETPISHLQANLCAPG
jgi:hypothetical protein